MWDYVQSVNYGWNQTNNNFVHCTYLSTKASNKILATNIRSTIARYTSQKTTALVTFSNDNTDILGTKYFCIKRSFQFRSQTGNCFEAWPEGIKRAKYLSEIAIPTSSPCQQQPLSTSLKYGLRHSIRQPDDLRHSLRQSEFAAAAKFPRILEVSLRRLNSVGGKILLPPSTSWDCVPVPERADVAVPLRRTSASFLPEDDYCLFPRQWSPVKSKVTKTRLSFEKYSLKSSDGFFRKY